MKSGRRFSREGLAFDPWDTLKSEDGLRGARRRFVQRTLVNSRLKSFADCTGGRTALDFWLWQTEIAQTCEYSSINFSARMRTAHVSLEQSSYRYLHLTPCDRLEIGTLWRKLAQFRG